jgi:hypothetical protein
MKNNWSKGRTVMTLFYFKYFKNKTMFIGQKLGQVIWVMEQNKHGICEQISYSKWKSLLQKKDITVKKRVIKMLK